MRMRTGQQAAARWVLMLAPALSLAILAGCAHHTPDPDSTPIRRPRTASVEVPGAIESPGRGACATNEFLKSEVPKVTTEVLKSERTYRFLDTEPSLVLRGLDALSVDGARLSVLVTAKGRFDEFEGPVSETIEVSQYEANPGVALITHTITLGIGLLVAPVKSAQHAFGCVDRRVIRREVRAEDSRPTGAAQWRDVPANLLLRIEGVGPSRDFTVRHLPQGTSSHTVDLLDAIVEHRVDGASTLRVSCLNCAAPPAQDGVQVLPPARELSIKADFGRVRAAEVGRREQIAEAARVEQLAREREARVLEHARSSLIGRWETRDACVNAERQDFGMFFEAGPAGQLRSRRVVMEGNRLVTQAIADAVRLQVVDAQAGVVEADLPQIVPGSRRPAPQRLRFSISAAQMRIVSLTDAGVERVRAGLRVSDGRPVDPLYNCAHPSMLAARKEAEQRREAQLRQAEALRQQAEREAAERRRLEEAARLEREREAAERRRIEEERRRRQEI